jgi:hypothetical protein
MIDFLPPITTLVQDCLFVLFIGLENSDSSSDAPKSNSQNVWMDASVLRRLGVLLLIVSRSSLRRLSYKIGWLNPC